MVVDGLGLGLALWISLANVQDRDAGPELVEPIHVEPIHREVPTVRKVWVDSRYRGEWRKEAKKMEYRRGSGGASSRRQMI